MRKSFQLSVLLLKSSDEVELLLDGLLLSYGGGLFVFDLLLGASTLAADLHTISKKKD